MKKIILLFSLCSVLGLTACSKDSSDAASGEGDQFLDPPSVVIDPLPIPLDPEEDTLDMHDIADDSAAPPSKVLLKWTKHPLPLPAQTMNGRDGEFFVALGGETAPLRTIYESEDGVNWEETVTIPEITSASQIIHFHRAAYIKTGPPANQLLRREAKGKWVEDDSTADFSYIWRKSGPYYTKTHIATQDGVASGDRLNFPVGEKFSSFNAFAPPFISATNKVIFFGDLVLKDKPDKILFGIYYNTITLSKEQPSSFLQAEFPSEELDASHNYARMMAYVYNRDEYLVGHNDLGSDGGAPPQFGVRFHKGDGQAKTWVPLPEIERHLSPTTPIHRLRQVTNIYFRGSFRTLILLDEGPSIDKLSCRILTSSDLIEFEETVVPNISCVWAYSNNKDNLIVFGQDLVKNQMVALSFSP